MKFKTSVSLEENTLIEIRELIKTGRFRNKSHVIDYSINKLINEIKNA